MLLYLDENYVINNDNWKSEKSSETDQTRVKLKTNSKQKTDQEDNHKEGDSNSKEHVGLSVYSVLKSTELNHKLVLYFL